MAVLFMFAFVGGSVIVAFILLRMLDAVNRPASPPTTLRKIFDKRKRLATKPLDIIRWWKVGVIAGAVTALICISDGLWEKKNLARGSATPQRVRYDDLVVRGPGDNIHVTITDFTFAPGYVVDEDDGSWQKVWIPMQPATVQGLNVHRRVVVRSSNIKTKAQLEDFYDRTEVTGLIFEDTSAYQGERNDLLRQRNRGLDPDDVLLVDEGREFPTRSGVNIELAIGWTSLAFAAFSAMQFLLHARRTEEGAVAHVLDDVDDPDLPRVLLLDGVQVNGSSPPKIVERLQLEMYGLLILAAGAALWAILWGLGTWRSFGRLERGEVQILSVWGPAEFFYYRWGREAAMLPFLAAVIVSAVVIVWAVRKIREFNAAVGPARIRTARVELDRKEPEFYRSLDEEGGIPLRTKILGGALLLALLCQLIWALTL